MITYERNTDSPLGAWVAAIDGDKRAGFQLQPERPLTSAEREAVKAAGKNQDDYVWVGYPVLKSSDPVKWSAEIQSRIASAQSLLREAAQLYGEIVPVDPQDSVSAFIGAKFSARHFIATEYQPTEDEAEERVTQRIAQFDYSFRSSGRWFQSGDGNPSQSKYSM